VGDVKIANRLKFFEHIEIEYQTMLFKITYTGIYF